MCRGLSRRSSERPFGPGPPGGFGRRCGPDPVIESVNGAWCGCRVLSHAAPGGGRACTPGRPACGRAAAAWLFVAASGGALPGPGIKYGWDTCRGADADARTSTGSKSWSVGSQRGMCVPVGKELRVGDASRGRASGFPKYRDFPPICKISGPQRPLLSGTDFVPRRCVAEAAAKVAEYFVPLSSERAKAPVCLPPFPPNPQRSDR